ncbi:MAG: hypothetical protein DKM23_03675 [Candidatus Melainabacteria bacterium]|nr:MAG: hypothetical protein DKM23_03675 [Candidatus Melainabacteria bacterium]
MQPYFFPYLGYYQMLSAVDKFVLLDDVNFIMRGYINRNSILLNGQAHKFSIPLEKPSQNKLINETKLNFLTKDKENFLKTITMAYKKAPFFNDFYPVLENIVNNDENDLTKYLKYSFEKIKDYLQIDTEILLSSKIEKDNSLRAQDRIIEINKQLASTQYINAIGGQELYNKADFTKNNIQLNFIKMSNIEYKQFNNEFVPNLSMIDVLMFNSKEKIKELLKQYELV